MSWFQTSKTASTPVLAIMAIALAACQTTAQTATPLAPIIVSAAQETKPIAFRKIVVKIPRYSPIGSIGHGLLCLPRGELTVSGGRYSLPTERFNDVFREELEQANYTVVGDPDELFGDPEISKAEYFVAGLVNSIQANVCYPMAGFGNFSSSKAGVHITIEWQIYDTLSRKVVSKYSTSGSSNISHGSNALSMAFDQAFAMATQNLLANKKFHALVNPNSPLNKPTQKAQTVVKNLGAQKVSFDQGKGISEDYLSDNVAVVRTPTGHGSGFLISPDTLVTNQHVVGTADKVRIIFVSGFETTGRIIASDPVRDIALIKVTPGKGQGLSIASKTPKIGEDVFSYGAPLKEELSGTLRKGVISAFREERGLKFIQSDAPINPGNSGGPLLDKNGNVVGVATKGIFVGGAQQGLNYFIPINNLIKASVASQTAEAGDADAQFELGNRYEFGEGVRQSDSEAFKWYQKAALQGHSSAQYNLGLMYSNGKGIEKSATTAFGWFKRAAEQNHAKAQYSLGVMYSEGRGVEQNFVEAQFWLNLSAVSGVKVADQRRKENAKYMSRAEIDKAQTKTAGWLNTKANGS